MRGGREGLLAAGYAHLRTLKRGSTQRRMVSRPLSCVIIAVFLALSLAGCGNEQVKYGGEVYTRVNGSELQRELSGKQVEDAVEEYTYFDKDNRFFQSHDFGNPDKGSYRFEQGRVCLKYDHDTRPWRSKCLFLLKRVMDGQLLLSDLKGSDYGPGAPGRR